ncbi:class IIc cyclic bacteriocin [Anaerococcus kampingiae]|uniref:Class IIc cyclic bacteriocin n=1 Tax=Anaerococcus kampingae TaxID=3115614 RepID=A0ABW9MC67_9FIRM
MTNKMTIKKTLKTVFFLALALILMPNIYFIANKLGITLAPGWYQNMVDWVSSGGTIAGAFAAIAGVTVPAWLSVAVAGFGLASA